MFLVWIAQKIEPSEHENLEFQSSPLNQFPAQIRFRGVSLHAETAETTTAETEKHVIQDDG